MKPTFSSVILRSGLGSMLAGAVLLLAPGASPVQGHAATSQAPVAAPNCSDQRNLNDPTNTSHDALVSYWFAIDHLGHTSAFCTLFGNVDPGDVVTAHFTVVSPAPAGLEVTLLSNISPAGSPRNQTLFDCASFGVAPDPTSAADTCLSAGSAELTVNVPDCGFQVDLIYGEADAQVVEGQYASQDRWINGMVAKASTVCSTTTPTPTPTPAATPTPTPTPGGGVLGTSTTPTPAGGVLGITSPGTGAGVAGNAPLAMLLLVLGAGAVAFALRRRSSDVP